ncbi:YbaN family protein [Yoonia maritima]|uniref:YbaN family protein n=1 Tax=Yoonia maritima TaxID=1435347 RepID=UPI0037356E3C
MARIFGSSRKTLFQGLWLLAGWVSLGLGAIGVVLPVLPTTPFVILAAFAFGNGSPRLQKRLEDHATFGPMIADWKATGAIAPRYKAMAILMMGAALTASIFFRMPPMVIMIQAACMIGAGTFVLTRPNGSA